MSIESFYTSQTGQQAAIAAKGAGAKGSAGPVQGLAFFDMFLATLEKTIDKNIQQMNGKAAKSDSDLNAETEAALLKALANSEYTLEELSKLEDPQLIDVLGLNGQIDDEMILQIKPPGAKDLSSVLESIILTSEADFRPALHNLQRILQKINAMLEQENPALINANLDSGQITDLQNKVEQLLKNKDQDIDGEEFAGVFVGLIKILPPQARPEVIVTGKSIVISQTPMNISAGQNQGPANDGLGQMNSLLHHGGEAGEGTGDFKAELESGIENLIKGMGKKDGDLKLTAGNAPNASALKTLPDLSLLQNWPTTGTLLTSWEISPEAMDELGLTLNSFSATSTGALTALVTHGTHAALPHPGTQMVAATIQRAAASGDPSNITLQLDPPELGRVEIKMSFGKDSKIKAIMTVEKQDALHLLQRDAHILERALQEAGLDSEGGLTFQLASDEHPFGQDGSHDGTKHGSGRGGNKDENAEDLLETTMTWMVDPETGHTRYNIFA